jgi:hypothetical protein
MGWEIDVVMWRYEERRGREEARNVLYVQYTYPASTAFGQGHLRTGGSQLQFQYVQESTTLEIPTPCSWFIMHYSQSVHQSSSVAVSTPRPTPTLSGIPAAHAEYNQAPTGVAMNCAR